MNVILDLLPINDILIYTQNGSSPFLKQYKINNMYSFILSKKNKEQLKKN